MKTMFRFLRDCSLALSLMLMLTVPMAHAQTALDTGDADFLRDLSGNMIIDVDGGTDTYEEVEAQFVETLKIHIDEFNRGEGRSYLMEYYGIDDLSTRAKISTSVDNAIRTFLSLDLPLTDTMKEYLASCNSTGDLTSASFSEFDKIVYDILKVHTDEFDETNRASAEAYFDTYTDCPAPMPTRLKNAVQKALDRFIADNRGTVAVPVTISSSDFNQAEMDFLKTCDSLMPFDFETLKTNADLEDFLVEILDIHRDEFDETSSDAAENYLYEYTNCPRIFPTNVLRLQDFFEKAAGRIVAKILSGDLSRVEMDALNKCDSLMPFDDIKTIKELEDRLVEILKIHTQEFDENDRASSDKYLRGYTNCLRPFSQRLEDVFNRAVDVFMGVAAPVPAPVVVGNVVCPNCDDLKKNLKNLEGQYEKKAEAARDAATKFHDLRKRLNNALDELIDGIDGCENNRNADLSSATSSASGLVYGREFACNSNAAIERLTNALNQFWRNHRGSELEKELDEAEERLEELQKEVRELSAKIKAAKKKLDECLERVRAIKACIKLVNDLLDGVGRVVPQFDFDISTPVEFEISFEQHNVQKGVRFAENFREVASTRVDIDRFSDISGKSERVRKAIRDLTNRVPIFQGNEDGVTFGADEISARAIIATVLYRIGQQAGLPGYTNIEIDYSLRPDDVPVGIWYEDALIHAIMMGIFIPQDGKVRPSDPVNWAELATILRRWANFTPISPSAEPYPGVAVGIWYTQEVNTLKRLGLLDDFASLSPEGNPKKFEMLLVIHRLIGLSGIFLEELAEEVEG